MHTQYEVLDPDKQYIRRINCGAARDHVASGHAFMMNMLLRKLPLTVSNFPSSYLHKIKYYYIRTKIGGHLFQTSFLYYDFWSEPDQNPEHKDDAAPQECRNAVNRYRKKQQ
jgi:hypothetical protein